MILGDLMALSALLTQYQILKPTEQALHRPTADQYLQALLAVFPAQPSDAQPQSPIGCIRLVGGKAMLSPRLQAKQAQGPAIVRNAAVFEITPADVYTCGDSRQRFPVRTALARSGSLGKTPAHRIPRVSPQAPACGQSRFLGHRKKKVDDADVR